MQIQLLTKRPQNGVKVQQNGRNRPAQFGRDSYKPDECRQCQQLGHLCVRPLGQAIWDEWGALTSFL